MNAACGALVYCSPGKLTIYSSANAVLLCPLRISEERICVCDTTDELLGRYSIQCDMWALGVIGRDAASAVS